MIKQKCTGSRINKIVIFILKKPNYTQKFTINTKLKSLQNEECLPYVFILLKSTDYSLKVPSNYCEKASELKANFSSFSDGFIFR